MSRHCSGSPTCPVVMHGNESRCPDHAKAKRKDTDLLRGSAQKRTYTYQWSLISKRFLAAHPVCGERHDGSRDAVNSLCVRLGIDRAAECVDHTIPKSQGGTNDDHNLMAACRRCNKWKYDTIEKGNSARS